MNDEENNTAIKTEHEFMPQAEIQGSTKRIVTMLNMSPTTASQHSTLVPVSPTLLPTSQMAPYSQKIQRLIFMF